VFGQWTAPVAYRDTLSDVLPVPEVVPFWNLKQSA